MMMGGGDKAPVGGAAAQPIDHDWAWVQRGDGTDPAAAAAESSYLDLGTVAWLRGQFGLVLDRLDRLELLQAAINSVGDAVQHSAGVATQQAQNLLNVFGRTQATTEQNPSAVPQRIKVWYKSPAIVAGAAVFVAVFTSNLLWKIGEGVASGISYQLGWSSSEDVFSQKQITAAPQDDTSKKAVVVYENFNKDLQTDDDFAALREKRRRGIDN